MRSIIFVLLCLAPAFATAMDAPPACAAQVIGTSDIVYDARIIRSSEIEDKKAAFDNPFYNWQLEVRVIKRIKGDVGKKETIYFTYGPRAFDRREVREEPRLGDLGAHLKRGEAYRFRFKAEDRIKTKDGEYITLLPDCLPTRTVNPDIN